MTSAGPLGWGEARIVALLMEGCHHEAVGELVAWLGPEVRRFLLATLRDEATADEAFARFQHHVYLGLDRWSRTGSLRLWALDQARAAANRTPPKRTLRYQTVPGTPRWPPGRAVVDPPTSPDAGGVQDFTDLRALLPEDDVLLLWLRIGQGLDWHAVAAGFAERGRPADPETVRARFEEVKTVIALALERHSPGSDGDD